MTIKNKIKPIINKLPRLKNSYIYTNNKLKSLNLKTPTSIVFFVTNKCNEKCKHCFYWKNLNKKEKELSLEEIKKTVKSLKHPYNINITGGEPFLRKDLIEICKIFDKNNVNSLRIDTNGLDHNHIFKTTKKILEECKSPLAIQVSIDGTEDIHNKIRGIKTAYQGAINTIKSLKKLKKEKNQFDITISTTITSQNYNNLEKFIRETQYLKIKHSFSLIRGKNFGLYNLDPKINSQITPKDPTSENISNDDLDKIYLTISNLNKEFNFLSNIHKLYLKYSIDIIKNREKILKCYAGKINAVIYPNGDVSLCEFTNPIDNLEEFNFDFYKLWNSEKAKFMKKQITSCFCTHGCNMITSMGLDFKTFKRTI